MNTVKAAVFSNKDNRFLVRGFIWTDEDRPAGWLLDVMGYAMGLGVKYEKELLSIPLDDEGCMVIPHAVTEMRSPNLMHGGGHVLMISGPLFDECVRAAA